VRVSQLLFKGRAEADALAAALDAGAPFDEAAARFFPGLPAGQRPWELGFLQYQQVPEQWWPTLERLAPGEVSAPIAGPNERFWVLRLDERRPSQATPQALRAGLRAAVRARKVEAARAAAAQELRSRAMLQHVDDP
jgi:parvulin-like peptidyl-prolyl isomerase